MIRDDVLYLVADAPEAHGLFDNHTETQRMVYCQVKSVGREEFYRAREFDLEPTYVFVLSDPLEYRGEKVALYDGRRYNVIRSYITGRLVELTCGEAKTDA